MVLSIDQQAVNTIRVLSADVVKGANSGHPGKWLFLMRIYMEIKKLTHFCS
jgi:transketolase